MVTMEGTARRARIEDVARVAGVHKSTVSRTWSQPDLVDPGTRARVEKAADELGYRPNTIAHMLATSTNPLVPLLVPDISNPFFAELARAVAAAVEPHGWHVTLCDTRGDAAGQRRYLESVAQLQVELLVVAPGREEDLAELVRWAEQARQVTVLVDRAPEDAPVSSVSVDQRRGIELAMEHLRERGHVRLAHVAGPPTTLTGRERCQRFVDAAGAFGLDAAVVPGGYDIPAGREGADAVLQLEPVPTALIAANDLCAIGLIGRFRERGLRVPEDISVVGYDGLDMTAYLQPPLTTVRQPIGELAATAVEIGLAGVDHVRAGGVHTPRHTRLEPALVVRGSTSTPAGKHNDRARRTESGARSV